MVGGYGWWFHTYNFPGLRRDRAGQFTIHHIILPYTYTSIYTLVYYPPLPYSTIYTIFSTLPYLPHAVLPYIFILHHLSRHCRKLFQLPEVQYLMLVSKEVGFSLKACTKQDVTRGWNLVTRFWGTKHLANHTFGQKNKKCLVLLIVIVLIFLELPPHNLWAFLPCGTSTKAHFKEQVSVKGE